MVSRSHDIVAELRMHSFTVDCDTFSNEEKVAVIVLVTSIEVVARGSEAILALSFSTSFFGVSDVKTRNASTRVNCWQYLRWMSI